MKIYYVDLRVSEVFSSESTDSQKTALFELLNPASLALAVSLRLYQNLTATLTATAFQKVQAAINRQRRFFMKLRSNH
jgi:hypothetical protein